MGRLMGKFFLKNVKHEICIHEVYFDIERSFTDSAIYKKNQADCRNSV